MKGSLRASKVDILGLRSRVTGNSVPPKALEGLGQWQSPDGAVEAPRLRSTALDFTPFIQFGTGWNEDKHGKPGRERKPGSALS